uniref:Uncharacterized protein n=1 Tax=Tanacetum cinerariifolium TaxID=118510 RepID=A0A699HX29_TANCI|nr:hypothetical protein [Tanacetum cinerariifolium]
MDGGGKQLVVNKQKRRPRKNVTMPDPSEPTPQKKRGRPSGSGTKHRAADVDHNGKGNIIDHIDDLENMIQNLEVLFNRASKERPGNKDIQ